MWGILVLIWVLIIFPGLANLTAKLAEKPPSDPISIAIGVVAVVVAIASFAYLMRKIWQSPCYG